MEFFLRSYVPSDAEALGQIFHRSVHEGAAYKYTVKECTAWCPEPPVGEAWSAKLAGSDCVVAETNGNLVGFMCRQGDYFDMAYVLPEAMGTGVAGVLCAVLEGRALANGVEQMTVHASHLAEPFFARRGWAPVERRDVVRRGVTLRNCVMEKRLERGSVAA